MATVKETKRLLKALWIKACRFDKIPIDSKFVVFSSNNPHTERQHKVYSLMSNQNLYYLPVG